MRPRTLKITIWIMAALNPLGYALLWDKPRPQAVLILMFVVFSLLIAVGYWVLWHFWLGKGWARLLVLLNCFVCFYNLHDLQRLRSANLAVQFMLLGEAAVAAFLLYWLNTSEAKSFFKPTEQQ
jgi:hypothetical protein